MRRHSVLVVFLTVFIDLIGFGIVLPLVPLYSRNLAEHSTIVDTLIRLLESLRLPGSMAIGLVVDDAIVVVE